MKRLIYRVYTFLKEHSESCQFFDDFGIMVQIFLGLICLSALIFKRYLEKPQRPWSIWFFDTLKQGAGQITQHTSNLFLASSLEENSGLECEWYLNHVMADCTLGVLFCYIYLKLILMLLKGTSYEFQIGDYGQGEITDDDDRQTKWKFKSIMYQLIIWVFIVILAKMSTVSILFIFYKMVKGIGKVILSPIKRDPKLKLVFVMIVIPTIFNIIQFWFTDNFIKFEKASPEEKNMENNHNEIQKEEEECLIEIKNRNVEKDKYNTNKETDYQPLPTTDYSEKYIEKENPVILPENKKDLILLNQT